MRVEENIFSIYTISK